MWLRVSVDRLLERIETRARHAMAFCDGGYTTNLPLAALARAGRRADGKGGAAVAGRYVLTAENAAPEGGDIGFRVVKVQATLLIDEITLNPS